MTVNVSVTVGVSVTVSVGVCVGVLVTVEVGVCVSVGVLVGNGVFVIVGVGVLVGVFVGVFVGGGYVGFSGLDLDEQETCASIPETIIMLAKNSGKIFIRSSFQRIYGRMERPIRASPLHETAESPIFQ